MPRICSSNNDPMDFCNRCFPGEKTAEKRYADHDKTGLGPDNRGNCFAYDAEHPPYEDTDYKCHTCGKALDENDNEPRRRG